MVNVLPVLSTPYSLPWQAISDLGIPPVVSGALSVLHFCHYLGRELFRLEFRTEAPAQYLAGVLLNSQCGQHAFVQAAAKVVSIAKECLGVIEEGGRLKTSVEFLCESLQLPHKVSVLYSAQRFAQPDPELAVQSKPWVAWMWWPIAIVISKISLVVRRIFDLLAGCWRLHLSMWSLSEALGSDPHIQSEAIDDILVNLGEIADQVGGQNRRLARAVDQYRPWIDRALQLMGIQWSAQAIVHTLEGFAAGAEQAAEALAIPIQGAGEATCGATALAGSLASH
jgi:hypothetical protein